MKELQISKRLKAVAEFVGKGLVLADVGCDHGYIPIYLIQKKQIPRAIAMDVNQGPLFRADSHIREWGLESYIETRLSDGVKALKPGEVQSVVIAGMGGPLMEKIILEGAEVFAQVQELILQPQSEIGAFRRFLGEQGYCIEAENMVEEDGKYYPMMKAVHGNMDYASQAEYCYGQKLLRQNHPVLLEFLLREQRKAEEILERLKDSETASARTRRLEMEEEEKIRKEALAYYEM